MEDVRPAASLRAPLRLPHKALMGAGPANAPPRVLHASAQPLVGHLHAEALRVMDDIKDGLRYAFQTTNPVTLCLSCAGHGGMEASLTNLLEPGDVAVVAVNGHWGARASDMVTRHGSRVVKLEAPLGQPVTLEAAEEAVSKHRPRLLFLVQAESSTSVLQPLEGFGPMCHKYGTLLVVDTVASLGGTPLWTDRWELDVVYTGSQKVLNAPPGLAPITFSPRAMQRITSRQKPCSVYYWDIMQLGDYWGCFGNPRKYHHTGPVSLFFALREALAILAAEGLTASLRRHAEAAARLHAGLQRLGAEFLVPDPRHRVPTLTAFSFPNVDLQAVARTAMTRHGVELSGGLGPTVGRILRIGLMGVNASEDAVDNVLSVLEDSIKNPILTNKL
ncbi:Serine--pyruvate aminotransferase, mitochondrial [Frankliniella fusca]|uniref:Alanine--glyoxylate aminotransferase n=1 Tax=Frankliniella fusca TaxID=407009 RepID=A0AAE1GZF4_9NEOP|nr:Serine--pyruvate aminotransferase, mitochondrial [Frankliniella fusca]